MGGPRLLVIQHEPEAPAAWLGEWWEQRGIALDVCRGDLAHPVPARVDRRVHAGLVVLGGAMGACDDAAYDWLTPTKALIRRCVAEEVPFLGICLGHQLAAVALGGTVERNPRGRTIGLTPVGLTDEGREDPLLRGVDSALAVHYNDDIVTEPPPEATVLARSPGGEIQALRLGPSAWGVQFHPETSPEVFASWGSDLAASEHEPLVRAVSAARDQLAHTWSVLAERFPPR